MSEKDFSCFEKIKTYIIIGVIAVILTNIAGLFIIYFKLKSKIYHTHFMTKESLEKVYDVELDLDRGTGHMVIDKND